MKADFDTKDCRILAIDPSSTGFGYAVLESPERLVDFGMRRADKEKNDRCVKHARDLIELYNPDMLVLEDIAKNTKRCERTQDLILRLHELGQEHNVRTEAVGNDEILRIFEAPTRYAAACAVAKRFPALGMRLPPPRKPWDGSKPRMAMFHATAMAIASSQRRTDGETRAGESN